MATDGLSSPVGPGWDAGRSEGYFTSIEDIQVGDVVLSKSDETGEISYRKVVNTFIRQTEAIYTVSFTDGTTLETTWNHPFRVKKQGHALEKFSVENTDWIQANDLHPGDVALGADGQELVVTEIVIDERAETVYNFEVEGYHTYFVGEVGVWVHNECTKTSPLLLGVGRSFMHIIDTPIVISDLARQKLSQDEYRKQGLEPPPLDPMDPIFTGLYDEFVTKPIKEECKCNRSGISEQEFDRRYQIGDALTGAATVVFSSFSAIRGTLGNNLKKVTRSSVTQQSVAPAGFDPGSAFKNAISPYKNGEKLTNAGRAVTKHPQYFGFESSEALQKVYRSPESINDLASSRLKEILQQGTIKTGAGGRYPNGWVTYTLPNGNAASWETNGKFIGFRGRK